MRKLLIPLLFSLPCFGQAFSNITLQNSPGNYARVTPYATVTLCTSGDTSAPCTSKVSTYTTDALSSQCTQNASSGTFPGKPTSGTNCNNPGNADANGNFTLYANSGLYRMCITSSKQTLCQEIQIGSGNTGCTLSGTGPCTLTSVFGTAPIPPPAGESALSFDINGSPVFSINGGAYVQPCLISTGCPPTSLTFPVGGFTAPAGTNASLAPATNGNLPFAYSQNGDNSYDTYWGIDTYCDSTPSTGTGPPCPSTVGIGNDAGTPAIYKRTYFNGTQSSPSKYKNSFVNVTYLSGTQTVLTNQERAFSTYLTTSSGDSSTRYSLAATQNEVDWLGTGTFSAHTDSEVTAGSYQAVDGHTGSISAPSLGINGSRTDVSRLASAGTLGSCNPCWSGIRARAYNNSSVSLGGSAMAGGHFTAIDVSGGGGAASGIGYGVMIDAPDTGQTFSSENILLFLHDNSNTITGNSNWAFLSDTAGHVEFGGALGLGAGIQTESSTINVQGSFLNTGSLGTAQLTTPTFSNGSVTPIGAAGATTYTYKVNCVDGNGNTTQLSSAGTTTTGNATLDGTNYNRIIYTPSLGASSCNTYRTAGGITQGIIHTDTPAWAKGTWLVPSITVLDQGLTGDTTTGPTINTTAAVQGFKVQTLTNCAAVGSSANPSLVACAAAASGSFSCATAASTGTCVISTTAVTANSQIFIQEDASLGTRLSVTCNTNSITPTSAPVSARSAGVSFTINLGTVTTNPECFSYFIVN